MQVQVKSVLLGILFSIIFLACKKNDPCPPVSSSVSEEIAMQNSLYIPAEKTIMKGTTVKWINRDTYAHTVTSYENKFDSGNLNEGQTFQFTFDSAGTYDYYCLYHLPGMKGKIIVK